MDGSSSSPWAPIGWMRVRRWMTFVTTSWREGDGFPLRSIHHFLPYFPWSFRAERKKKKTGRQGVDSPIVYYRYVDDIFALFESRTACDNFQAWLNTLHPALKFTTELESSNTLPFLDVLVDRSNLGFTISVYRKPTFRGQYTQWDSYSSTRNKIALINIKVNRAQRICSPCNLPAKIDKIMNILGENGYPEHIVKRYMHKYLNTTNDWKIGPAKCPVYIRMPWKGQSSRRFEVQIKHIVSNKFLAVQPQ